MPDSNLLDLTAAARGLGRYYQRHRFTVDQAVAMAIHKFPQVAGREADVRAGWNAERRGR